MESSNALSRALSPVVLQNTLDRSHPDTSLHPISKTEGRLPNRKTGRRVAHGAGGLWRADLRARGSRRRTLRASDTPARTTIAGAEAIEHLRLDDGAARLRFVLLRGRFQYSTRFRYDRRVQPHSSTSRVAFQHTLHRLHPRPVYIPTFKKTPNVQEFR